MSEATRSETDTEPTYCTIFRNLVENLKKHYPHLDSNGRYKEALAIMRYTHKEYYQDACEAFGSFSAPRNYTGTWRDNYD